ncbi:MAG: BTAD domain-containing putative transcriptional regulator, partial [Trebonia sp.]
MEVLSPSGWTGINAAKWRSLLACLLVRPGQLVPTESLIFELWGENPPSTANNLVSIYVHRLKKVIGDTEGKDLVYRAPGYRLRVSNQDLDSQVFELLVADGRGALEASDTERAAALLGEALGLWRGSLFADVQQTALLARQADRAEELRLAATELRIEADLFCGRPGYVIAELLGLVAEHPLREGFWALLMRALEAAGRRAEALETYGQAQQVIADELGVDPGAELQRLFQELLAADARTEAPPPSVKGRAAPGPQRTAGPPSAPGAPGAPRPDAKTPAAAEAAGGAATAPGVEPVSGAADSPGDTDDQDSGGQDAPGSIAIATFAGLAAGTPAADLPPQADPANPANLANPADQGTGAGSAPTPAQLPADIGDFTGRETHAAHLCALLVGEAKATNPGAVRIAVVSGAAGLGKTTLAVHAAHQVRGFFPDGQLYVDLLGASAQPAASGEVLAR